MEHLEDNAELHALVALNLIQGIGGHITRQLVSYCGSASDVFNTTKGKLLKVPGIGNKLADSIISHKVFEQAEAVILQAQRDNVEILTVFDKHYPDRLKSLDDAPPLLYYKGNVGLNHERVLAIVGTRQATKYSHDLLQEFLSDLIPYDVQVVSGLALGVDIIAHRQSLKNGIPTIGVMANGLDIVYPADHKKTAHEMTTAGGLLTENAFGSKPDAPKFPARNRIIAGMSDAIIVVEAAAKGGAQITAQIANSYNKDVFAFPGPVNAPYSIGTNQLIKSHQANLITSVKDLEYILGWTTNPNEDAKAEKPKINLAELDLDPTELKTLTALEEVDKIVLDELSRKTGLAVNQLSTTLLMLEFKGLVKPLPGQLFTSCLN